MSKDKYPSTFSPQMEAIVFIMLQILFATRAILKIGGYLRAILCKNQTKWEMKNFDPPLKFAWK